MEKIQLKYTVIILYIAIILICILGIATADIYLLASSTVLFILTIPILLKNPNLIRIPKKLNMGAEIAYEKTFHISNIILAYLGIILITLRVEYPSYELTGYVLLCIIAMNAIIFKIIQKNIEKEYLR